MQANRKTKWQVKREASYARLVESAAQRFHEHGFAATSVESIVAGTGYTGGAFYFHFANKTECFWHVVADRERRRGDWAAELTKGLTPADASLESVLERAFARFAAAEDGLHEWVLVMVDFHQQHRDDPEVQARLAEVYAGWRRNVARFVSALQAGGWVDPGRDAELVARQVFAYAEGTIVHDRLYRGGGDSESREALLDGLVRLLA